MSEYIVDYRWLQSRLFGQAKHLRDDLTKIVRCRDCRFHCHVIADDYCMRPDGNGDYMRTEVEPDGFCKWGERKHD